MMRLLLMLLLVSTLGCQGGKVKEGSNRLPTHAKIVQDLGNDWLVFEITTEGKSRRFLYRYWPSGNSTTEVVTEVSP